MQTGAVGAWQFASPGAGASHPVDRSMMWMSFVAPASRIPDPAACPGDAGEAAPSALDPA